MKTRPSPGQRSRRWAVWAVGFALLGLTACSDDEPTDPMTVAPLAPIGQVDDAILPRQIAGYSVLGSWPTMGQLEATYARDDDPAALAVVALSTDRAQLATPLGEDQWFGQSRCGVLDEVDNVTQAACITPLTDGVMTVVGGSVQTPSDLSQLANAIVETLP
ncbi:MAG: hypothetical protein LBL92_02975 [Propionibacteriaceae bacterium]|nr:hypothetical protein [Propionibacteriaceae bacterium]